MHARSYLSFLDETGDRIRTLVRSELVEEIEVIVEGLKLCSSILHGLAGFCEQDQNSTDYLKSARMTLAGRVLMNLQSAYILQERGFKTECLSLCRGALESSFTLKYLEHNPDQARTWLVSGFEQTNVFSFRKMVTKTGDLVPNYEDYVHLCKYAHPTGMTLFGYVQFSGKWDLALHKHCCFWIVVILRRYITIVLHLFYGELFQDDRPCLRYLAKCQQLLVMLRQTYVKEMMIELKTKKPFL